jgi:hypothetical protein
MAPASPPTPPPLDEALSVWRDACARRDAGSLPQDERDPGDADEPGEAGALQEAEERQEAEEAAAEAVQNAAEEVLEERTAHHGELAGVSYRGRERAEEIEGIRSCIEQAAASLEEALESR